MPNEVPTPVNVDVLYARFTHPVYGELHEVRREYPDIPIVLSELSPGDRMKNAVAGGLILFPGVLSPLGALGHSLSIAMEHSGPDTGWTPPLPGLFPNGFQLSADILPAGDSIHAWAAQTSGDAFRAGIDAAGGLFAIALSPLGVLEGGCAPSPEAEAKISPVLTPNALSDPETASLTTTYRTLQDPAARRMQDVVDEAAITWKTQTGMAPNTLTLDTVMPPRTDLEKGGTPWYVAQDKDHRLWVPFYGPDGHLVRYLPVPSAADNPQSIQWQKGVYPRVRVNLSNGEYGIYDQTIGAFVVVREGVDSAPVLSAAASRRPDLARFAIERYNALDQTAPGTKSIVRLEPYESHGQTLFLATVIVPNRTESIWGQDTKGTFTPLSFGADTVWIAKDGYLVAYRRQGANGNTLAPTGDVFDPDKELGNQIVKLAPATKTPEPTVAPPATKPPEPTATITLRPPTATSEPSATPDLRPAPVVIARYGDEKDLINFNYPDKGGIPYTIHVYDEETTFRLNRGEFGRRMFSYLTFQTKQAYDLWRDGKAPGGKIYDTSAYFLPVAEARWVDQTKGTFIIRSQIVNPAGITANLEITLSKDNPVYSHIPPSEKRWGAYFYQPMGSDGPVKAGPGLMRDRKITLNSENEEFDVIGIGGRDATVANYIKDRVDAVANPKQTIKIEGITNADGVWLMLLAH